MTLDEIGLNYKTDKASNGHGYLSFYERLFCCYGIQPRLLEIGVQFGLSLRTWMEYFETVRVTGIDIVDNPEARSSAYDIVIGNAYSEAMVARFSYPNLSFNIIIDDGSHDADDQRWFLQNYHRLLAPGGIMIVEDVRPAWAAYVVHKALPEGFTHAIVDFTTTSPLPDSGLILAWDSRAT